MRITFLEPPPVGNKIPERFAGCSYELYHFPDLANFYIMANLYNAGFEVSYIDAILAGYSSDRFYDKLKQDDSDFYIIHSVILSKRTDLFTIKRIREIKKDVIIIFHGPEPTRVPEEYLIDEKILVFRGEPEVNVLNYLKKEEERGMSYLRGSMFRHIEPAGELVNLDNLPFPLRDHKSLKPYIESYFNPKFRQKPYTIMMTSRGCRFKCLFCVPVSISFARELEYRRYFNKKPPVSIASARHVTDEFKEIKKQGFKSVMIVDDQFLWSKDRTFEICEGIKDLGVEWGCLSRADFLIDEEIVKALASSGCHSVDIGVESLDQKILDYIQKELTVDTIYLALENLKKYKINPKINIMLGTCPEETSQDIGNMINRLKKLYAGEVMFSLATPFKGTEFYTFCKDSGYLVDESDEIDPFNKSIVTYPSLTKKELENLQKYAYRSYYLRPRYIWHRIKSYTKLSDIFRDIKLAINLLR